MQNWQKRILFTSWITYASFYLIRVNMSVAIPGIIKEFGISKTAMGGVLTALFAAYAFGQFVNGQIGDKFGARKVVTVGLIISALLNIIFGFTQGFLISMIVIWGLNGFFQAMGWGPIVKTVASWFQPQKRGVASGILGTSYILGSSLSLLLAGFVAGHWGWRWAFWFPAIVTIIVALHWAIRIRNSCEDEGFEPIERVEVDKEKAEESGIAIKYAGVKHSLGLILTDKRVWLASLCLFGLNIVRYGFLDWAPTYFFQVQKAAISVAAYKTLIFPLAGAVGALSSGWLSEKVFRRRKALIAAIMLLVLAVAIWSFYQIPVGNWILSLIVLAIIGFLTFGPHMMIVTILPMDLGTKERASSVAGFIDGWGYIGAALTGVGTGFLVDHFSWHAAFNFWISGAIIAAVLIGGLMSFKKKKIFMDDTQPTPFAKSREYKNMRIIDIGCGNGRDTYFFSKDNSVIGIDPLAPDDPKLFLKDKIENILPKLEKTDVVYCRFLFHTISEKVEDLIIDWAAKNAKELVIEARAVGDSISPDSAIRLADPDELISKVTNAGFGSVKTHLGYGMAVFNEEDPYVLRVIARQV